MDETENYFRARKEQSPNGHKRPLRIVQTGTTILTKKVTIEEGSGAEDDVSQHEGGDDG